MSIISSVSSALGIGNSSIVKSASSAISNLLSMSSGINKSGNAASAAIPSAINISASPNISSAANILSQTNLLGGNISAPSISDLSLKLSSLPSLPSFPSLTTAPTPLAIPTFTSGPNDSLMSVDIYSVSDIGTSLNSIQSSIPAISVPALSAFQGSGASTTNLNAVVNSAASAVKSISSINPLSNIQQQVPAMFGSIKSLPKGCGGALTSGIVKDLNKLSKQKGLMNGKGFNANTSKLNCINAIGNTLNTMAKANGCNNIPFSFPDSSALLASLANAVKSALQVGIPGAFSAMICGLTNALSIDKIAGSVTKDVSLFGDLPSLSGMAKFTTPGALSAIAPNLIKDFSSFFSKTAPGVTGNVSDHIDMMASYDAIDPNWDSVVTDGNGTISDLTPVMGASGDFYDTVTNGVTATSSSVVISNNIGPFPDSTVALATNSVPNQDLLLASSLTNTNTDVKSCISNDFPNISITPVSASSTTNVPSSDPGVPSSDPSVPVIPDKNDPVAMKNYKDNYSFINHESSTRNNFDGTSTTVNKTIKEYLYDTSPYYTKHGTVISTETIKTSNSTGDVISYNIK